MSVLVYTDPDLSLYVLVSVEIISAMTPDQAEVYMARLLLQQQAEKCDNSTATCERILRWLYQDPPDHATSGREMAAAASAR